MDAAPAPSGPDDKRSDEPLDVPSETFVSGEEEAREIQHARFEGKGLTFNADMGVAEVREFCGRASMSRSALDYRHHILDETEHL